MNCRWFNWRRAFGFCSGSQNVNCLYVTHTRYHTYRTEHNNNNNNNNTSAAQRYGGGVLLLTFILRLSVRCKTTGGRASQCCVVRPHEKIQQCAISHLIPAPALLCMHKLPLLLLVLVLRAVSQHKTHAVRGLAVLCCIIVRRPGFSASGFVAEAQGVVLTTHAPHTSATTIWRQVITHGWPPPPIGVFWCFPVFREDLETNRF